MSVEFISNFNLNAIDNVRKVRKEIQSLDTRIEAYSEEYINLIDKLRTLELELVSAIEQAEEALKLFDIVPVDKDVLLSYAQKISRYTSGPPLVNGVRLNILSHPPIPQDVHMRHGMLFNQEALFAALDKRTEEEILEVMNVDVDYTSPVIHHTPLKEQVTLELLDLDL